MTTDIEIKYFPFAGKEACAVLQHHHVLLPWTDLRRRLGTPFDVLTLDHHTDVLPAFGRSGADGPYSFSDAGSVKEALSLLRHDEHIDWALKSGVISHSFIISHESFTEPADPRMKIILDPRWPETQLILNSAPEAKAVADIAIESHFLKDNLKDIALKKPYVLDIDLDYFITDRSASPEDASEFMRLASEAELVTFSMEREWQKILRIKGESLDSDSILDRLKQL